MLHKAFEILKFLFKDSNILLLSLFILSFITIYVGFIYFFEPISFSTVFRKVLPLFIVVMIMLTSSAVSSYLNQNQNDRDLRLMNIELKYELNDIKEKLNDKKLLSSYLNADGSEKQEIFDKISSKIESEGNLKYLNDLKKNIKSEQLNDFFDIKINKSLNRLKEESDNLSRRGNVNLIIGMLLSIGGLIVLGYSILNYNHVGNINDLLIFIVPKTSFVLLIELFAYFFLNLYRKSLEDIKYYQNEITNIEAKYLSLQMAKSMNNHKLIASVLEQLVKTERNFVLEKDQSTIELEKERLSSNNANNTLQAIKEIFLNKK